MLEDVLGCVAVLIGAVVMCFTDISIIDSVMSIGVALFIPSKKKIREELKEHGISHATLELESSNEHCHEESCHVEFDNSAGHHHHH